jgi:hypothetical protein
VTLAELNHRLGALALQRRVTRDSLVADHGVPPRTLRDAVAGRPINTITAAKLLRLVVVVARPGEAIGLTLTLPGVAAPVRLIPAPLLTPL